MRASKQAGVTLVELLLVAAVSSVLSLAVASLLIFSIEQFRMLVQQHKIEEHSLWAAYHLRGFLSQAVNLQVATCNLNNSNISSESSRGVIVSGYNDSTCPLSPSSPSIVIIAVFPRENGVYVNGINLYTSAIFYEPPRATTIETHPGKLYFDVGNQASGSPHFFSPGGTDVVYTGLSNFTITDVEPMGAEDLCISAGGCSATRQMAKSLKATLTFRYFLFPDGKGGRYDYHDLDPSTPNTIERCEGQSLPCRDITRDVHINFHNNIMVKCSHMMTGCDPSSRPTYKERIFGNIYFYKMVIPPEVLFPL